MPRPRLATGILGELPDAPSRGHPRLQPEALLGAPFFADSCCPSGHGPSHRRQLHDPSPPWQPLMLSNTCERNDREGGGHAHRLLLKRRVLVQVTKGASGREMNATVGSVGTRTPHEPSTLFLHRHQRPRRVNLIATPQRATTATTITAHPMSTRRDTYKPTNTQHQTSG